jgi:hypothetical protein
MIKILNEPSINSGIQVIFKVCADGKLIKLLTFWTLSIVLLFKLKTSGDSD